MSDWRQWGWSWDLFCEYLAIGLIAALVFLVITVTEYFFVAGALH